MSTTLNHLVLSRTQLAQASELADAGSTALARTQLLFAADNALIALATRSELTVTRDGVALDRDDVAERLAALGAAPGAIPPALRELDAGPDELDAGFGAVGALIDAYLDHPAAAPVPAPDVPLYGGAAGMLDARGADAAARGLTRVAAAIRSALRR